MILHSRAESVHGRGAYGRHLKHGVRMLLRSPAFAASAVLILRKGQVVAYDSVARLRELMSESSLEGVFSQLTQPEDTGAIAQRILEVVAG